jgi:DNA-binding MarR family transcriptional regulator
MTTTEDSCYGLPAWLPDSVRLYLSHVEQGMSLRELARLEGCHPSTILRQVRRFESRRDDPLVDEALLHLAQFASTDAPTLARKDKTEMTAALRPDPALSDEATIEREARRILRRLCEPGAMLAIAADMERAVVLRDLPGGKPARIAVVDRVVAQAFALKEWIASRGNGRVTTYEITATGRAALKRLLAADEHARAGFAEAATPFADQHRVWGEREIDDDVDGNARRVRYNLAESPVAALGRRRDKDGKPFLAPDLIAAAERLREDFELAQMGTRVAQNWDRFLTVGDRGAFSSSGGPAEGPRGARERVAAALRDLGPGLGDMVLRCCCYLEGLETAERRMGWAARSGKIVLRIALQRLKRHYDETYGGSDSLIG